MKGLGLPHRSWGFLWVFAGMGPASVAPRRQQFQGIVSGTRQITAVQAALIRQAPHQRGVAACRAMVTNPTLVLADEPTGALDSKNSKLLLERFDALNESFGTTILMVTHDSFAASYCQRVLFIRDGRIFTELRRGNLTRRVFFDQIMGVVATIGGGQDDVL